MAEATQAGVADDRYEVGCETGMVGRFPAYGARAGRAVGIVGAVNQIVRYVGGPLDGKQLDVSDWTLVELRTGTYEIVDGWQDRADYEPDEGGDPLLWRYRGPVPD